MSSMSCKSIKTDCGHSHHLRCYCWEDQGSGYTYLDEYGICVFCSGEFSTGTVVCSDEYGQIKICPFLN